MYSSSSGLACLCDCLTIFIKCVILNHINYELATVETVEEGKEAQRAPR